MATRAKDPLLTVDEAAERLNTAPRLIRRLMSERKVAVVRVGRSPRIPESEIESYIASRTIAAIRPTVTAWRGRAA